jgi:hypothetical protein
MAGNTRGKLKECFEGVHRNFEWSQKHLEKAIALVADMNPSLTEGITALHEGIASLDNLAQEVYSKL